ncbi:MAG TPA: SdpI family protein [Gemmatimonadota bacterium]|nr:SdpI family protein [Gemmatimonadota bacterium]
MNKRWIGPVLIVLMVAFALAVYGRLPEQVPTHFELSGEPDDWMDRFPGAFLLPAIAAGIYLLLFALRRIDPRRAHYARFEDTYWVILNVLALMMAVMQGLSLGLALGWPIDMGRAITVTIGLLFVGLGNYLPRIRSNWWIGIRTPWTLESEAVWRETHRVGGWTFVAAGLVLVVAGVFLPAGPREWVSGIALAVGVAVPLVYSYLAYRRASAPSKGAEAS